MYSQKADDNREKLIVPLFEIVVYPKSQTKLMADKVTGEVLLNEMKNSEFVNAVGLTVISGTKTSDLSEDTLYKTGNLLKITFVQPADNGYLIVAKAIERVEVVSLYRKNGLFYTTYRHVHDLPDFDEDAEAELMANIKKTIHEISSRYQGSEQFTHPINKMDSIDQIMGLVMPYMPVKLAEKQKLLELASVRERYLQFLHILTKHKENINLQIEMAKKVTDKISKSHREAMLREQLKVIQEELDEGDDSASGDAAYREMIENSKMPDEVKKKAFAELKKLEAGGSHNPEAHVIRNYLDLLLDLPWVTEEKKSIDIAEARRVLESNHNGLEKSRRELSSIWQ